MADGSIIIDTLLNNDGVENGIGKLKNTLGKVGNGISTVFSTATAAIAGTATEIVGATGVGAKYNADIEQLQTSFSVMTGSAEKATQIVQNLKDVGAKTPFELKDLAQTTQLLMNYGMTADDAQSKMMMLGDISQGNADKMNSIATAYGQMSSAGKVQLEDVKQMIDAGFNPLQEISKSTGESMSSLYDRISKGTLSVDEITASMQRSTSVGGQYFQSMDKQSKTVSGQISTLKDNMNNLLGSLANGFSTSLGGIILPLLNDTMTGLQNAFTTGGIEGFAAKLGSSLGSLIGQISQQMPALIDTGIKIINSLITGIQDNLPQILTGASQIINSLITGIIQILPQLMPVAIQILNTLIQVILQNLPLIIGLGIQLLLQLIQGITQALPQLIAMLPQIIQTIITIILQNLPLILMAGIQLLIAIINGIVLALPQLIAMLPQIIQTIITTLLDNLPLLIDAGIQLLVAIINGIIQCLPQLIAMLPQIISTIVSTLATNFPEIVQAGGKILTSLISGIIAILGNLGEAAGEIISTIGDVLKELPGKALEWGKDMVQGFIDGIKNMISNIGSAVSGIADKIESFLHFSRPDTGPLRDYEKWMPDMIDGLTKTLELSSPQLYNASKKLASKLADGLDLSNMYNKMQSAVAFETGKISTNLSTTATVGKVINANIQVEGSDIYMDSTKVGRAVTPIISKTIRGAGAY